MARSSIIIVAIVAGVMWALSAEALRIVAPWEGMVVMADKLLEVEWAGKENGTRYDIDLHYCGPYSCFDDDCGMFVASLCLEGDAGCTAEDGGYEVVMPEPIIPGDGYRMRVSQVGGDNVRCSDSFSLMPSDDSTVDKGASLTVVSPMSDSLALAGEEYTVEFSYNNGLGSSVGRFMIDLYEAEGSGDCGNWQTSICDKPDSGCKDSTGDYNVVIPASTASGMYRIRVGLLGDHSTYACSEAFKVTLPDSPIWMWGHNLHPSSAMSTEGTR